MTRVLAGVKALALIAGPLVCGILYFLIEAPDRGPGVFLETEQGTYRLSGHPTHSPHSLSDARTSAAVIADRGAVAFFVVGLPVPATGPVARLYVFAMDDADSTFRSEYVSLPVTISQINARAFRVTSDQLATWGPETEAFRRYQDVLPNHHGSRATIEAWIGLEIQRTAAGSPEMYAVRVGPR